MGGTSKARDTTFTCHTDSSISENTVTNILPACLSTTIVDGISCACWTRCSWWSASKMANVFIDDGIGCPRWTMIGAVTSFLTWNINVPVPSRMVLPHLQDVQQKIDPNLDWTNVRMFWKGLKDQQWPNNVFLQFMAYEPPPVTAKLGGFQILHCATLWWLSPLCPCSIAPPQRCIFQPIHSASLQHFLNIIADLFLVSLILLFLPLPVSSTTTDLQGKEGSPSSMVWSSEENAQFLMYCHPLAGGDSLSSCTGALSLPSSCPILSLMNQKCPTLSASE